MERRRSSNIKNLLAILHNGIITEDTKHLYEGLDKNSSEFKEMYRLVRTICTKFRLEHHSD